MSKHKCSQPRTDPSVRTFALNCLNIAHNRLNITLNRLNILTLNKTACKLKTGKSQNKQLSGNLIRVKTINLSSKQPRKLIWHASSSESN